MIKLILKNTTWSEPEPEGTEPEPEPGLEPEQEREQAGRCDAEPVSEPAAEPEPELEAACGTGRLDVPSMLTIVLTTSPVQSNPSTDLLEGCLGSFAHVPALAGVRRIIVCDGCRETDAISGKRGFRSGWVRG